MKLGYRLGDIALEHQSKTTPSGFSSWTSKASQAAAAQNVKLFFFSHQHNYVTFRDKTKHNTLTTDFELKHQSKTIPSGFSCSLGLHKLVRLQLMYVAMFHYPFCKL